MSRKDRIRLPLHTDRRTLRKIECAARDCDMSVTSWLRAVVVAALAEMEEDK